MGSFGDATSHWIMQSEQYEEAYGGPSLPALTMAGEVLIGAFANSSLSIPSLAIEGEASKNDIANFSWTLPTLLISGQAAISEFAQANLALEFLSISGAVQINDVANGAITIPFFTVANQTLYHVYADGAVTLPMFTIFTGISRITDQVSMVMNIRNRALSNYNNYNFNSFCQFNGKPLGANKTEIFDLSSGIQDDHNEMDWNFRFPFIDLEMKTKKHMRQAWISFKSNGDIIVTVILPDGTEYEYDLIGYEVTEDGVRVKFGKGIKSKYVALDFKSKNGSTIDLDTIRIHFDGFHKR